jgi:hypothetical protein
MGGLVKLSLQGNRIHSVDLMDFDWYVAYANSAAMLILMCVLCAWPLGASLKC